MKRDSLEGSGHTPMYNPNILPLTLQIDAERFNKHATLKTMELYNNYLEYLS